MGLVLAIGTRFAVLPFVLTVAKILQVHLHFSRGTVSTLQAAGIALACYGYFRPLKCPVCGKAISLNDDEGDDVPGFCPNCDANLHKPLGGHPGAPVA